MLIKDFSSASVSLARLCACTWVYWATFLVSKKTNFWMTIFITSFTFENCIGKCYCAHGFSDIYLLHLSHVSCMLCILDSLFYKMPPCGAIFDHVNGCRLPIPLANIFEAKEWAASFTCTPVKLAIEEVLWNPSFSHPTYVSQPSKACLAELSMYAWAFGLLQHSSVWSSIMPSDTQNSIWGLKLSTTERLEPSI